MKPFKKYLKKRKKAIDLLLAKPRLAYTSATFHKLRIEIKKLNAFFDVIKFCSKDIRRKKIFKPFKRLFRQAGKVRELQIEEEMLKKYFDGNFLNEYRKNLKLVRLKERDKYFSIASEKLAASLKKRFQEVIAYIDQIDEDKVNLYSEDRRHRIETIISQNTLKVSQIHKLRKGLKRYSYNHRLLAIDNKNEISVKKDRLLKFLGKWHDCQVIIRHIQLAEEAFGINPEELSQLEEMEAKVSADGEILLNEIYKTIPESAFYAKY